MTGSNYDRRSSHCNANRALLPGLQAPHSRSKRSIANILEEEGYIADGAAARPEGEGEHPPKALDGGLAEGLPGGQQDLGVAAGAEDVAAELELGLEVAEVVDLAVVDDPRRAVGRAHRLPPGHQVDDGQAGHTQAYGRLDVHALVVRSPVLEGRHHRLHQLGWRSPDVPGDPEIGRAHV